MGTWADFATKEGDKHRWIATVKGDGWPYGQGPWKDSGIKLRNGQKFKDAASFASAVKRMTRMWREDGMAWYAPGRYPWGADDAGKTPLIADYIYVWDASTGAVSIDKADAGRDNRRIYPANLPGNVAEAKKTPAQKIAATKKKLSLLDEAAKIAATAGVKDPSKVPGLGMFKPEKYIGEVKWDDDGGLTMDEVLHMSFYQGTYGGAKIVVGYIQIWGDGPNGTWVFKGALEKDWSGSVGEMYGDEESRRHIAKSLGDKWLGLQWTEAGMQGHHYVTLTFGHGSYKGWF